MLVGRFTQVHPQVETKAVQVVGRAAGKTNLHAPEGDPIKDITAVRRVVFAMKGGRVYKNDAGKP